MPNYDFKCSDCGHEFTRQLNISERKKAACVKCGSSRLEQLFRCCNVLGGKGGALPEDGMSKTSSCSRTGGCSGCSGC